MLLKQEGSSQAFWSNTGPIALLAVLRAAIAKLTRLCISSLSFFRFPKFSKSNTHAMVSIRIVRVEVNGLLIGAESFHVALEAIKSIAFIIVSNRKVGVEANSVLIGSQGFLVPLEVSECISFSQPLLHRFL